MLCSRPSASARARNVLAIAGALLAGGLGCASIAGAAVAPADQWGFEQVTPANKGGGNVHSIDTFQTRADGRAFLLTATGPFDGVPAESAPLYTRYLAKRTESGWANRALDAPIDPIPPTSISAVMSVVGTSHDLAYAVVASTRALAPGAVAGGGNVYLRNTATGSYELIAASASKRLAQDLVVLMGALSVKYVAPDGNAVLFMARVALVDGVVPGDAASTLYKWSRGAGLEVVSKLPASEGGGYVFSGNSVGNNNEYLARGSVPRVNGAEDVYFSSFENALGPVYHWSDGESTVVSRSQIPNDLSPPVSADVEATTSGGDFALIQTHSTARLTTDTPTFDAGTPEAGGGRVLYRYERQSGKLRYVGVVNDLTAPGNAIQMSADGQTIVFKTQYQLTPDAAEFLGGWDPNTKQNIYAWRDGTLRFIAAVDAGARAEVVGKWLRVLSDDGRYFSFSDNSQGTAQRFGVADNTSTKCDREGTAMPTLCDQVYVFDVQEGTLKCASCRVDGARPRGNSGDPTTRDPGYMRLNAHQAQTVANDGTTFFTSTDDLVAQDSNGLPDVYAYRDGALRLVSGGVQGASARFLDATPDGTSIFFATNAQLAETDTDRAVDVYVTRLGAGFAYQRMPEPPPCAGSDCREVQSAPLPALIGSVSFVGDGNTPLSPDPVKATVGVSKLKAVTGSAARLKVRVPGAGRISVAGASIAGKSVSASKAGSYSVRVALSAKAKRSLRRKGTLKVSVRVSYRAVDGRSAAKSVAVTFKQRKSKKGGR